MICAQRRLQAADPIQSSCATGKKMASFPSCCQRQCTIIPQNSMDGLKVCCRNLDGQIRSLQIVMASTTKKSPTSSCKTFSPLSSPAAKTYHLSACTKSYKLVSRCGPPRTSLPCSLKTLTLMTPPTMFRVPILENL